MVQLSVHSSAVDGMEQVLRRMKIGVSILVSAASHQVDWWVGSGAEDQPPKHGMQETALLRLSSPGWMPARAGR